MDTEFNLSDSRQSSIFHMASIVYLIDQNLRDTALKKHKISYNQFRLIQYLYSNGPETIGKLSNFLSIRQAVLSRVVDQCCSKNLCNREKMVHDNRMVYVHITKNGELLFQKIWSLALSLVDKALDGINSKDIDKLHETLVKVNNNILK